jgi:hypothetical protein
MKSGRMISRPPGNQSPNAECTCMSHKPGIRYWPLPSITRAFFGTWNPAASETEVMRSPVMTTVASGRTEDVPGLIKVTRVITICPGTFSVCAVAHNTNNKQIDIGIAARRDPHDFSPARTLNFNLLFRLMAGSYRSTRDLCGKASSEIGCGLSVG